MPLRLRGKVPISPRPRMEVSMRRTGAQQGSMERKTVQRSGDERSRRQRVYEKP